MTRAFETLAPIFCCLLLSAAFSLAVDPVEPAKDIITETLKLKPSAPSKVWPDAGQDNKLSPNYTATVTVDVTQTEQIGNTIYTLTDGPTALTASTDPGVIWTVSNDTYSITNTSEDETTASVMITCIWSAGNTGGGGGNGSANRIRTAVANLTLLDSEVSWFFQRTRNWTKDGLEISFGTIMTDTNGYGLERWTLTEFGTNAATPVDPGWQVIAAAVGPGSPSWERSASVFSVTPSKGKVKMLYNDGSSEERTSEEELAFIEIKLKSVSFVGQRNRAIKSDDEATTYSSEHWNDPDGDGDSADGHSYPVAYISSSTAFESKLTISPVWVLDPQVDGVDIKIRATGTNSTVIDSVNADVSGTTVDLPNPAEASNKFDNEKVRYWEEFELNFEASFKNELEWIEAGTSANQLYVTRGEPSSPKLWHTVIHIGCNNSDQLTSEADIITDVWSTFSNNNDLKRIDGTPLTYYANYNCPVGGTGNLLNTTDGQCGAWVLFFMDCLKVHAISRENNLCTFEMPLGKGFIVKEWQFNGLGASGNNSFPYRGIPDVPFKNQNSYNWVSTEVTVKNSKDGKNNHNPASLFKNHQVIFIDGVYYDPSYGVTYTGKGDFQNQCVDGFWMNSIESLREDDLEPPTDLNGNGRTTDLVEWEVYLFKKATSTVEVEDKYTSY